MQNVGFCFVISKFKQLHSLHEFPCFLMHLHSYMKQMVKGHGLLSLCLHIVTNDVQCNMYLFDPFRQIRILCALVGTEKCTIYWLSQDRLLKTWYRQICTYFLILCTYFVFMNKQSPQFELLLDAGERAVILTEFNWTLVWQSFCDIVIRVF